jgi:hypothetical protein
MRQLAVLAALLSAIAPIATAATLQGRNAAGNLPKLSWGACNASLVYNNTEVQCTRLAVPLDYTSSSSGSNNTLLLDLIRVPAWKGPSRGSILLNFGGPGENGISSMVAYKSLMWK